MKHIELENQLKQRIKKMRLAAGIIAIAGFIMTAVFWYAYEASREVTVHEHKYFDYEVVTYNDDMIWFILLGAFIIFLAVVTLVVDFRYHWVSTHDIDGCFVTVYTGGRGYKLYINGELKDEITSLSEKHYLEAPINGGATVTVSFGTHFGFLTGHMTFSNGHPPVDIPVEPDAEY